MIRRGCAVGADFSVWVWFCLWFYNGFGFRVSCSPIRGISVGVLADFGKGVGSGGPPNFTAPVLGARCSVLGARCSAYLQLIFSLSSAYLQLIFSFSSAYPQLIFSLSSAYLQLLFSLSSAYILFIFSLSSAYLQLIF